VKLSKTSESNALLTNLLTTSMFFSSLQHHLRSESKLYQLQPWQCTYREVIETSHVDCQDVSLLVRESCPNTSPTPSSSQYLFPEQVLVSQSQDDYDSEDQHNHLPPQHFKNDTIQFDMLHSTQVSDVPTLASTTTQSVCSHSISTFTPSLK